MPADTSREVVGDASSIDQTRVEDASPVGEALADDSAGAEAPVARRHRPSTAAGRRRWINAQLDAGRGVTGGEVERRYGSRNGAREVAQVKAERAQLRAASATEVA